MIIPIRNLVPLEEDEKYCLMDIYRRRLWNLPGVVVARAIIVFLIVFSDVPFAILSAINDVLLGGRLSKLVAYLYSVGWDIKWTAIILIAIGLSCRYFLKNILPYKLDADSGIKEKAPITIVKKEHFPVTGQYFVQLEGYPRHIEVDFETYISCKEWGYMFMDRAIKSKYIF